MHSRTPLSDEPRQREKRQQRNKKRHARRSRSRYRKYLARVDFSTMFRPVLETPISRLTMFSVSNPRGSETCSFSVTSFPFQQKELIPYQTDEDSNDFNDKFHYTADYPNETNWVAFRNPFREVASVSKRVLITDHSPEWQLRVHLLLTTISLVVKFPHVIEDMILKYAARLCEKVVLDIDQAFVRNKVLGSEDPALMHLMEEARATTCHPVTWCPWCNGDEGEDGFIPSHGGTSLFLISWQGLYFEIGSVLWTKDEKILAFLLDNSWLILDRKESLHLHLINVKFLIRQVDSNAQIAKWHGTPDSFMFITDCDNHGLTKRTYSISSMEQVDQVVAYFFRPRDQ